VWLQKEVCEARAESAASAASSVQQPVLKICILKMAKSKQGRRFFDISKLHNNENKYLSRFNQNTLYEFICFQ
jgi:hypothetical protein